MKPAQFHVRSSEMDVSVLIQVGWAVVGTVSANEMVSIDGWWLSRVKLERPFRGRGIAEKGLATLTEALAEHRGSRMLRVCPGGYGSHLPSLMRWYQIQGFRKVKGDVEMLEFDLRPSGEGQ